ncbi:MAG TPA: hypothetical protein VFO30_08485 [Chthoniobacterales bacterium]|nr:hypothetical protein [Chthoniobacterales bacterium]
MKASIVISVLFAAVALADDFKTTTGQEYKNVTVSRIEPDGLVVVASYGIIKIPFKELPNEVQEKYHYDLAAAEKFAAQTATDQHALYLQTKEAKERRQRELEATLKAQPTAAQAASTPRAPTPKGFSPLRQIIADEHPATAMTALYGTIRQVLDDGLLVRVHETKLIGPERLPGGAIIFLPGTFVDRFYDGDRIQVIGTFVGTYQYGSVIGAKRTARAMQVREIHKLVEFPPNLR